MVSRHADLQALCAELNEIKLDVLEDKLFQMGADGSSVTSAIAFCNAKGRSRGWGYYKTDVVHSGEVEHQHTHLHINSRMQALQELDDMELEALINERAAALARSDPGARTTLIEGKAETVSGTGKPRTFKEPEGI